MKSLEEILSEIENLQSRISTLLKEVNKLQKFNLKNIICNNDRYVNKILFKVHELQGKVDALMWATL